MNVIDVKQLQCFVTLAEVGHFGRAADQLNTTQPPLSRKLAALETRLGVRLLYRSAHRVTLTDAGSHFYQKAKAILESLRQVESTVKSVATTDGGRLTLGLSPWVGHARLLAVISAVMHRLPHVNLTLDEVQSHSTFRDIASGSVDAAIGIADGSAFGLRKRSLWQEALTLVVAARHPLAGSRMMSMLELQSLPTIACLGPLSELTSPDGDLASWSGLSTDTRIEVERPDTLLSLVEDNAGAALVPASFRFRFAHAEVAFVELQDAPRVEFQVVWASDNENPCLPVLLDALETVA